MINHIATAALLTAIAVPWADARAAEPVTLPEVEVRADLGSDCRLDVRYRFRFRETSTRTIVPTLGPFEEGHRMIDVRGADGDRNVGVVLFPKGGNAYTARFTHPTAAGHLYDVTLHYVVESAVVAPTRVNGQPYAHVTWSLPRWDLPVQNLEVNFGLPLTVPASTALRDPLKAETLTALGIVSPAARTDFDRWAFVPASQAEGGRRAVVLRAGKDRLPMGAALRINLYLPIRHFSVVVPDPPAPEETAGAHALAREVPLSEQPDLSRPPAPKPPAPDPWIRLEAAPAPGEGAAPAEGATDATAPDAAAGRPTAPAGPDATLILLECAAGAVILALAAWLVFFHTPRRPPTRGPRPGPPPAR